jgi:hypothetical protein
VVQPPFSLLAKRFAVIERFDLLEVFLAIRSACDDDFSSLIVRTISPIEVYLPAPMTTAR